jgi:hypothetical protein
VNRADPSLTGREIVTALTVGYEVGLRVGNAATTSPFFSTDFIRSTMDGATCLP